MRVITRKRLNEFAKIHPDTKNALAQWYQLVKANKFSSFAELRQIFPSADQVGKLTVFNIGGNKVRLIAAIHYNRKKNLYSCSVNSSRIRSKKMERIMPTLNITQTITAWSSIAENIFVPHTEEEYEHLVNILDTLIDQIGEDETHPLASLMEVIGVLIENYENEHTPELS